MISPCSKYLHCGPENEKLDWQTDWLTRVTVNPDPRVWSVDTTSPEELSHLTEIRIPYYWCTVPDTVSTSKRSFWFEDINQYKVWLMFASHNSFQWYHASVITYQIIDNPTVCSTYWSDWQQRKCQSIIGMLTVIIVWQVYNRAPSCMYSIISMN